MLPKKNQPKRRLRPSEMMTVGARTPSPTPAVPPPPSKKRKPKSLKQLTEASQSSQQPSQSNAAGKRWHNDGINGGPHSYDLLTEWLGDADNLDLLKHGLRGTKCVDGAQVCSEWMQAQGGPMLRSAKAILGEYDRLRKTWSAADAWVNGTGNGEGIQTLRDAKPGEEDKAKKKIDDMVYGLCPKYDDLNPIFTNRIGGTAALRGDSSVPLSQDAVFNGMREHRQSKKGKERAMPPPSPSPPPPSQPQLPDPLLMDTLDREPTFSPSHWVEPDDEAEVLENIGRADVLDRSSPIGQASLADSRSGPSSTWPSRPSPTPNTFDGSTQSYMESEANWRAKKEAEWKKQEAYREKKLHAVELEVDIRRKEQIREMAKELRQRNPDLSVERSLEDAKDLLDRV